MEKVTYIIPIHEFNEEVKTYLTRALESLKTLTDANTFKTLFVGPKLVLDKCAELYKALECPLKMDVVTTDVNDVYEKINIAVMKCVTPYFSVLEFDDMFYPYWNKFAQKVLSKKTYSVILPIVELVNTNKEPVGFMNEIAWDAAFSDVLGFIGVEELKVFKDYNVTGGYIKTDDFISCGKLKPSMKIAAWFELLMRMSHNEHKIYVAPRIGYVHTVLRDNSYMVNTKNDISVEEGQWLIKYALDEYTNKTDSNKKFEENK